MYEWGMCSGAFEGYRLVESDNLVYAMINLAPVIEGHTFVVPKRQMKLEDLTIEDSLSVNALWHRVNEKSKKTHSKKSPISATLTDKRHSSIPDHFHYHLIPCDRNMMCSHQRMVLRLSIFKNLIWNEWHGC